MASMTVSELMEARGVEAIAKGDVDGGARMIREARRARASVGRRAGESFRKAATVDDDDDGDDDGAAVPLLTRARARIRDVARRARAAERARILEELDEMIEDAISTSKLADRGEAAWRLLEAEAGRMRAADRSLTPDGAIAKAVEQNPRLASVYQEAFMTAGLADTEREGREFAKNQRRTNLPADSMADAVEKMAANLRAQDRRLTQERAVVKALEIVPGLYGEYVRARESGV